MLAASGSQPFLEPIHYMEENPIKIVETYKSTKRKSSKKKSTQKRKKITTKRRNSNRGTEISQLQNEIKIESESSSLHKSDEENGKYNRNDPLFTNEMLIKCEINEGKLELDGAGKTQPEESGTILKSDADEDFCLDEFTTDEEDDANADAYENAVSSEEEESEENDFENDGVLCSVNRRYTSRIRKPYKKTKSPSLKSCRDNCKFKCNTKYTDQQRVDMFHYYWQLSKEEKVNFIREHIRKQLSRRSRVTKIRHNSCYFLKNYKVEHISNSIKPEEQTPPVSEKENSSCDNTEELSKVCRKFFNGTLMISDQEIKEAFRDFELKPEKLVLPPKERAKGETANLAKEIPKEEKEPKLYLDPETGALTDTKPRTKCKSRKRGEPPPKRFPKPVRCAIRCKFNCSEKFSEEDRRQICDIFWSLDFKRRKDFVLSRIETEDVKAPTNPEFRKTNRPIRSYQTKFYLRSGPKSERFRVCKHFMENTLCVHPKFVDHAIKFSDKKTGAYTGSDRRGRKVPHNKTPAESKQTVLDHISSYPFWIPNKKSKIKYLHYSLAIKKMHSAYKEKCLAANIEPLSPRIYYKAFHEDFHILFLSNPHPKKGRGYFKTNPNISHYTGDEPGGCWVDITGTKLDLSYINPALTLDNQQKNSTSNISSTSSLISNSFASGLCAEPEPEVFRML